MRANCKYATGENNPQSKLTNDQREWIINMDKWRDEKIDRIDNEIERLKSEREKIRKQYSKKQMAMDFGVSPLTITRTINGTTRFK